MTNLIDLTQSPRLGCTISLYHLDLGVFGESSFYFVNAEEDRGAFVVSLGGQVYSPWPVEFSGVKHTLKGTSARPTLSISNFGRFFDSLMRDNNNLEGAKLTETRVFETFLDGKPNADPSQTFRPDVFYLDRMTLHNQTQIAWECSNPLDFGNKKIPARVMTADYCGWIYRHYEGGVFSYNNTANACPYTGTQSYDEFGNPVADANDKASKRLDTCCKPRFGENNPLPFGGFPAIGKFR